MHITHSSFLDKVLGRLDRLDPGDLHKLVQRLARERDFLETLFNTIEDGILVVNAQGRVVYSNRSAGRLLGLPTQETEDLEIARILPELDWAGMATAGTDGSAGVVRREIEVNYPRPRFLRVLAAPLAAQGEPGRGFALVLHDATEARRETFQAIENESLHGLTLLAASIAHEIGNPLNALHIHLQLLERELRRLRAQAAAVPAPLRRGGRRRPAAPPPRADAEDVLDRMQKFLGVAKGEIVRLDYMLKQFLAIRPSQPQFAMASLNAVVRETLDLLHPELENRGLQVETHLARALPEAPLDTDQIKQALVNLIKNSMQASTKGGLLAVQTGTLGDGVWVSVADTGVGIPQDELTRIFEPYFTTKNKGSGLGLMIVYRIVRDHGGRIDVESNPGQGTIFRIWLPVREPGPRLLPPAPEDEAHS